MLVQPGSDPVTSRTRLVDCVSLFCCEAGPVDQQATRTNEVVNAVVGHFLIILRDEAAAAGFPQSDRSNRRWQHLQEETNIAREQSGNGHSQTQLGKLLLQESQSGRQRSLLEVWLRRHKVPSNTQPESLHMPTQQFGISCPDLPLSAPIFSPIPPKLQE